MTMSSAGDVLPYAVIVLANMSLPADFISEEDSQLDTRARVDCGDYIGTSTDGVSYFLISETTMTWFEAKDTCAKCGYKLATVRSKAMSTLLYEELKNRTEVPDVWIAARESRKTFKYLSWDEDGTDIDSHAFDWFVNPLQGIKNYVCAVYEAKSKYTQRNWIVLRLCDDRKQVLCMSDFEWT